MKKIRIILADDHKLVAEGIRGLLEPQFELIAVVEDGRALVEAAKALDPDLIVVDISMPLLNGIDAVEKLAKIGVRAKVVFLSMHRDIAYVKRAFAAGASAFVLKHSAPQELVNAIRYAVKGRSYIAIGLDEEFSRGKKCFDYSDNRKHLLTGRQREVLQLLAEGRSAKEVAAILHISPRTAEYHKYKIMQDLHLKHSTELVQFALRNGLLQAPSL